MDHNHDNVVVDPTVLNQEFATIPSSSSVVAEIPQNAQHLCHDYDHGMDPVLASTDCLYVLRKVLKFAAASELAFLNMMRHVITCDTHHGVLKKQDDASLANLHYNRAVLRRHVHDLAQNIQAIERDMWPRVGGLDEANMSRLTGVKHSILDDFRDLLADARDLMEESKIGARSVMGLTSHAESQKAIVQAQGVERLTRLGTIFLPLSLLTSFFGMNSAVFGQGTVPLWVFFALAVPILLFSVLLLVPRAKLFVPGFRSRLEVRSKVAPDLESGRIHPVQT